MADEQDRGAYTPQSDAPLAFDARRASGGGAGSTALIISGVILMGLIIAVLLVYRHGARHTGQPPQLVGAPVGQTKAPPPPGAQPDDQTAGLQVYKTEVPPTAEASSAAPTFAPAPEQPRPIPAAQAAAVPAPAPVVSEPLRPAIAPPPVKTPPVVKPVVKTATAPTPPAKAVTASAKPPAPPKAKPAPKVVVADDSSDIPGVVVTPSPAKATAAAKTKSKPATAAAPAAAGGGFVQIGAFSSQALADKGWHDVGAALPGRLSGKTKKVETVSKDGKTFYRTSVTGFASRADAESFCAALKAAGHSCFAR